MMEASEGVVAVDFPVFETQGEDRYLTKKGHGSTIALTGMRSSTISAWKINSDVLHFLRNGRGAMKVIEAPSHLSLHFAFSVLDILPRSEYFLS